jgi:hypothetical protein
MCISFFNKTSIAPLFDTYYPKNKSTSIVTKGSRGRTL